MCGTCELLSLGGEAVIINGNLVGAVFYLS